MKIQLLGFETPFFSDLIKQVKGLLSNLNIEAQLEVIQNLEDILEFHPDYIPAIVINNELKIDYAFPHDFSREELKNLLLTEQQQR